MDSAQTREHGRAALVTLKLSALLGSGAGSKCGGGGQVAFLDQVYWYICSRLRISRLSSSISKFLITIRSIHIE